MNTSWIFGCAARLHQTENASVVDYIVTQPELRVDSRTKLMNWVIVAHNKLAYLKKHCTKQSTSLTVSWRLILLLIKNYNVLTRVQCTLASKGQDTYYCDPYTFYCYFSGGPVGIQDVINMEMVYMVHFYTELGMTCYHIIKSFCPAMVVAAARVTLKEKRLWHKTLEMYSGFKEKQLRKCAKIIMEKHSGIKDDSLRSHLYEKYSSKTRGAVALYPPAKLLSAAQSGTNTRDNIPPNMGALTSSLSRCLVIS